MNLMQLANPRILDQPIYIPGKPVEKVAEQFGIAEHEIVKLASNEILGVHHRKLWNKPWMH